MELVTSQIVLDIYITVIESPVSLDAEQQSFQIELKPSIEKHNMSELEGKDMFL